MGLALVELGWDLLLLSWDGFIFVKSLLVKGSCNHSLKYW